MVNKSIIIIQLVFLYLSIGQLQANTYMGGSFTANELEIDLSESHWSIDNNETKGWTFFLGKPLNDTLAIEAFASDLGHINIIRNERKQSINYKGLGVNLLYYLPSFDRQQRLTPFVKIGMGHFFTYFENKVNLKPWDDFSLITGVGVNYSLSNNVAIRFSYEQYQQAFNEIAFGVKWAINPAQTVESSSKEALVIKEDSPNSKKEKVVPIPVMVVDNYYGSDKKARINQPLDW